MIRLGSLAGYPFEGPRVLAGWTPPGVAAVYAILYKPEPETKPDRTRSSTSATPTTCRRERFPFKHPRASCWIKRAGEPLEAVHLHVRGARRAAARTASRSPTS